MSRFKLGLVVNPFAGIGGALALKGSDGAEIRDKALAMGAPKLANEKTALALEALVPLKSSLVIYTAAGEMGQDVASSLGFDTEVVYQPAHAQTEGADTEAAVEALLKANVDFLLFAGGDGTARNIIHSAQGKTPMLGIPAGCKIHSGVYAVTPSAAGNVLTKVVRGDLVSFGQAEVRDIDEGRFREGVVTSRYYGEMAVPGDLHYVQSVKMGGKESEELVLLDIAEYVAELIDDAPETQFVMGSGSTVEAVMERLGLPNTLLGVDVVRGGQLLASDVTAPQLQAMTKGQACKLVITLIGGQGHVFGRGNQQLSPQLLSQIGKDNILLVASKRKLQALGGRPLLCDTGDPLLDKQLQGLMPVITGYQDQVLYPLRNPELTDD